MKNKLSKIVKNLVIVSIVSLIIFTGFAYAAPVEEWNKIYDGNGIESSQQTSDNGYVFVSGDLYHQFLLKTDTRGNIQWNRSYIPFVHSVQQITGGGYILGGSDSSQFYSPARIIKTDTSGRALWTKFAPSWGIDSIFVAQQTTDGGYILMGCSLDVDLNYGRQDMMLIKTNSNGEQLWINYPSPYGGCIFSGQQTRDGGYIFVSASDGSNRDMLLVKTGNTGNREWSRTFGGTRNESGNSVIQSRDGGYIIAGSTASYGSGAYDGYLVKTDGSGNLVWKKTFGGTRNDYLTSVRQTTDRGFVLAGYTESYGSGGSDAWIIKTDASGNRQWDKTFGGTGSDHGMVAYQTRDGGYILAGDKNSKAWLIKINDTANLLRNPGFETVSGILPQYWAKSQTGIKAVFTYPATGRAGGKSVAIRYTTKETGKVALWQQTGIIVIPSKQYKLSGYMKLEGVTGGGVGRLNGASLRINWYTAAGTLIGTDLITKSGTFGWTRYEQTFTAPFGATKANVGGDLFNAAGKVTFDDLSFVRVS